MTTEVAIINREAIALAADSAVTVDMVNGRKIYNSANKLFALSQRNPVGIMIYGSAKLVGVPWETLIKVYRQKNLDVSFPRLRDYAKHFLAFIEHNTDYFFEEDKESAIRMFATRIFSSILEKIKTQKENTFKASGELKKSDERQIINAQIDNRLHDVQQINVLQNFQKVTVSSLISKYSHLFQEAVDNVFSERELTKQNKTKLVKIAAYSLRGKSFYNVYSGIVFAGFGEEEVIPDLVTYQVDLVADGKLRYAQLDGKSYYNRPHSIIIPFAQEEVIFTFISGISPDLETLSKLIVSRSLEKTLSFVAEALKSEKSIDEADAARVYESVSKKIDKLINEFSSSLNELKQQLYIEDALNIVNVLPKEELAEMAESLVNLTSLRKKVSAAEETVGGPTDVALITKGDGFIWIKRKHYFSPEINTDFFAKKNRSFINGNSRSMNNERQ